MPEGFVLKRKADSHVDTPACREMGTGPGRQRCTHAFGLYRFGWAGRPTATLKSIFLHVSVPQIQPLACVFANKTYLLLWTENTVHTAERPSSFMCRVSPTQPRKSPSLQRAPFPAPNTGAMFCESQCEQRSIFWGKNLPSKIKYISQQRY